MTITRHTRITIFRLGTFNVVTAILLSTLTAQHRSRLYSNGQLVISYNSQNQCLFLSSRAVDLPVEEEWRGNWGARIEIVYSRWT
jgi:hypothetical protein